MAGRRRIPLSRVCVFPNRTLLKENFAALIEDEDVNRAMPQVIHMHPSARFSTLRRGPEHPPHKKFPRHAEPLRAADIEQASPIPEREFLRPDRFSCAQSGTYCWPVVFMFGKQIAKLLSAFGESSAHKRFKQDLITRRDIARGFPVKDDDGGRNLRLRVKNRGWKCFRAAYVPATRDANGHRAKLLRARNGNEALSDFPLEGQNKD